MEWQDNALILAVQKHGETSQIVQSLTRTRGRIGAMVKGAASGKASSLWLTGQVVDLRWKGRLAEHLGYVQAEMILPAGSALMFDAAALASLREALELLRLSLPEHEPHPQLYDLTVGWLEWMCQSQRKPSMLKAALAIWQAGLLRELGYGFDWSQCVASQQPARMGDYSHISPKSGGAVLPEAAEPYRDKLLPLPMRYQPAVMEEDIQLAEGFSSEDATQALAISRHFLYQWVLAPMGRNVLWGI